MTRSGAIGGVVALALALASCSVPVATEVRSGGSVRARPEGGGTMGDSPHAVRHLWTAFAGGPDGLLLSDSALYVASPEVVSAFSIADGSEMWRAPLSDTSGPTLMWISEDLLFVSPPFEEIQAFDVGNGASVGLPLDTSVPTEGVESDRVPEGYQFDGSTLRYGGSEVWRRDGGDFDPYVRRFCDFTVVSDFDKGVEVVDDMGAQVLRIPLGRRDYDDGPVVVRGNVAAVVSSDGSVHVLVCESAFGR